MPPASVTDTAATGGHYYAVQLADGTWFFDLISSITGAFAVTMTGTIPNVGGGVQAGAIYFHLGLLSLKDPATGEIQPQWPTIVSSSGFASQVFADQGGDALVSSIHPGDPMLLFCSNVTTAGKFGLTSGYYGAA